MNIGIFTETYLPDVNGVVVSLVRFRKELEKMGHKVFVFAPGPDLQFHYSPKERIWEFPSAASLGKGVLRIAVPFANLRDFERFRLDIVHTYAPGPMGFLGVSVAKHFRLPLVHTFHTAIEDYLHYLHLKGGGVKVFVRWIIKYFLKKHDCIIAPSFAIKKYIAAYKINRPIHVLPTGIDLKEMRRIRCGGNQKNLLKKFGLSKKDSVLISVGRLGKEKGFDFLLKVVADLRKTHPEIKLIIAGDGPERNNLEKEAERLKVKNNIIFAGIVKQGDLFCLLRLAKIFVFASLTETQGLATMESIALGTPVVAIKAKGTEDVLAGGKGGFMTGKNIKSFAAKINRLLADEKLRKRKSAEALKQGDNFSSKKMAKKLAGIYEKLLTLKTAGDDTSF